MRQKLSKHIILSLNFLTKPHNSSTHTLKENKDINV